jgi:hypothetical protein
MYPVSDAFQTAIRQQGRQTSARVTVNFDNLYIKRTLTASAGNAYAAGQITQVINTNANTAHWATLDGSWVLGHDYRIAPKADTASSYEFGVWSVDLASDAMLTNSSSAFAAGTSDSDTTPIDIKDGSQVSLSMTAAAAVSNPTWTSVKGNRNLCHGLESWISRNSSDLSVTKNSGYISITKLADINAVHAYVPLTTTITKGTTYTLSVKIPER